MAGLGTSDNYNDVLTRDIYNNDIKAVFVQLFGSWLGDWDADDNIMRSVLAAPSYGLTCAWAGRPHWFMQHMAMGEPIGFSARLVAEPAWRFVRAYVVRGAWLDGLPGFFVAVTGAFYVFLRWAKVRERRLRAGA